MASGPFGSCVGGVRIRCVAQVRSQPLRSGRAGDHGQAAPLQWEPLGARRPGVLKAPHCLSVEPRPQLPGSWGLWVGVHMS